MAGSGDETSGSSNMHSARLQQADGDVSSPWSRVVRGAPADLDESPAPVENSIGPPTPPVSEGGQRRSPWNAPSNSVVEAEPVMGADAWPALSEAAKNLAKPSSSGSVSVQSASSPQKSSANITNNSLSPSLSRNRMKRSVSANERPVPVSPTPVGTNSEQPFRENNSRSNNNWGNEQHRNQGVGRNAIRNSGNRRDQERGSYERSYSGGRDGFVQQRHISRGLARSFIQPPPLVAQPFIQTPTRIASIASPIGYHEIHSPVFYVPPPHEIMGGISFVPQQAVYFAAPDPHLHMMLAKQIDYYFSPENLCRDTYLRQNMDKDGWVPISLIANFNRVKVLTNDIQFLLDIVRTSSVVEVQGDKIRKRNDWMNWPPLPSVASPVHGPQSPDSNSLAFRVTNMGLEEKMGTENSQSSSPSFSTSPNATGRSETLQGTKHFSSYVPVLEGQCNGKDHTSLDEA